MGQLRAQDACSSPTGSSHLMIEDGARRRCRSGEAPFHGCYYRGTAPARSLSSWAFLDPWEGRGLEEPGGPEGPGQPGQFWAILSHSKQIWTSRTSWTFARGHHHPGWFLVIAAHVFPSTTPSPRFWLPLGECGPQPCAPSWFGEQISPRMRSLCTAWCHPFELEDPEGAHLKTSHAAEGPVRGSVPVRSQKRPLVAAVVQVLLLLEVVEGGPGRVVMVMVVVDVCGGGSGSGGSGGSRRWRWR